MEDVLDTILPYYVNHEIEDLILDNDDWRVDFIMVFSFFICVNLSRTSICTSWRWLKN